MKPSAYRSMMLVKQNKNKTENTGLRRWTQEKWRNLTPISLGDDKFYPCGKKSKQQEQLNLPSVCRPSKRISSKTTKPLANEITRSQLKKAIDIKKQGKIISWSKL
jgi:hypothetical protein